MQSQKETSDKQLEELKEANSRAPTEDASEELRQQAETTKLVSYHVNRKNNECSMVVCYNDRNWKPSGSN